jgi:hypothetical protein
MAINRGPGGSGDASNAASNASAIATVKAQEAAESAANALSSANNAAISASSASASASSAAASASAASGSATTASSASSTATTQAGIATTKASEASTSAANALTSETNAIASAELAQDWATKTSGPVAGGEYSSKYHAGLASTSATSANNAKTAAEAARDATLAAYDQFDDRYLGTKTSDPTLDNDGNALVAGTLYFNSVSGVMRLYTGSAWVAAYVSGVASSVAVTPAGNIASTNVQTALQELDGEKQPTLVSGTNIKTLKGVSLLGSGEVGSVVVGQSSDTGSADIPTGTTAQRDVSPQAGFFRFNTTLGKFEGYTGSSWGSVGGGASGGGADEVFIENSQVVTANYTITSSKSASSTGPITINSGVTVTIPSGSRWVIL